MMNFICKSNSRSSLKDCRIRIVRCKSERYYVSIEKLRFSSWANGSPSWQILSESMDVSSPQSVINLLSAFMRDNWRGKTSFKQIRDLPILEEATSIWACKNLFKNAEEEYLKVIVDLEMPKLVIGYCSDGFYRIQDSNHGKCTAEDVIRYLAHRLTGEASRKPIIA